jgi:hypothetical protein
MCSLGCHFVFKQESVDIHILLEGDALQIKNILILILAADVSLKVRVHHGQFSSPGPNSGDC